ncbi:ABC transporter permease [Piscinibacter sp. XHJ-5]|uniref:ABC transporter permease n=1 Tax=Piscinibacter sp. XHJ-5 TaxID=3037797 RepID=UPI0024530BC3|nr:ABC transporter permease [Piscinibacter sp. XHJ-5]
MHPAFIVYRKELTDALRDRRTLLVVLMSSVLLGPLVLVALSVFIATFESRAEQREVHVVGIEHAPTLANFLERQTYTIKKAPPDYEQRLRAQKYADPVVVIPPDFEAGLVNGDAPIVEVISDSANRQASGSAGRIQRLLRGFNRERATLHLAMRGVAAELVEPMQLEERDLASTQTRATQFTGMLPFFVMLAVLYGALNAALDTTAGERERGSLEPLLMNPAERVSLVLGKWGAVASLGMLIAVLSSLSFIPAQWLLRSDTLAAMFQYGWREALLFLAVLLPFAAALSAVLMAVAIRCKSFKEAQASTAVLVLGISMLPLVQIFQQTGEEPWQWWVPALAQQTLMTRVLRGEGFSVEQVVVPLVVCVGLSVMGIVFVGRMLRVAAVR